MKTLPIKILFYLMFVPAFFLVSCRKDDVPNNTSSADQVPNSSGDYWKYSIKSSVGEKKGFLEVRIIKKGTLPDGRPVTTWIYSYPDFTDTVYKVSTDTTFDEYTVLPISGDIYPVMHYIFPLVTGMKWAINSTLASDSVKVVSETSITVPAGSFDHSIQMDFAGTHHIGNYWNNSQYWFTPHIGITRMNYVVYNLGPDKHNGIYELVEYRLK